MTVNFQKIQALIAERERHMRDLIRGLLRDLGLPRENIFQSGDGSEALETLRVRRVNFLITGWRMEPMDGLTLIRTLRDPDLTPAPGIPIIFSSASVDRELLDKAYAAGANEILVKPFNAQSIKSRVTAVLERPRPIIRTDTYVGPDTGGWTDDEDDKKYWTIC